MEFLVHVSSKVWSFCTHSVTRNSYTKSIAVILILTVGSWYAFAAPISFSPTIIRIPQGTTTTEVARELANAHIITNAPFLRILLRLSGESNKVQTGVYKFETPQSLFTIAYRLVTGEYGLPSVRITFVEGTTIREIAKDVVQAFPTLSEKEFLTAAYGEEGYLFPDTYFFQPGASAVTIVAAMRSNFDVKIASLAPDIRASGRSLSDIVTLASLVEKEARTTLHRRIVAGILLNRLQLGMPLQVDAVFGYIFGRNTYSPSFVDLKVDSPYNTYTHTGLPPGPIDNPGLDALEAVLHPTKTKYLYYLTDRNGIMHYATTYPGHQANQKKYLP